MNGARVLAIGLGLVLGLLALGPLAVLIVGGLRPDGLPSTPGWTFEHYVDVWGSSYDWRLAANTLVFAASGAALALALATTLSWLLERTDLPARRLFRALILMPMATPPLLLAIGWALVLAPRIGILAMALEPLIGPIERWFDIYGMTGLVCVQALAYAPTAVLMLSPAIRSLDPALEEAALMAGAGRWRVLWRVGLPLLRPAMLSVATILLIVGMLAFDVPAIIAIPGHVDLLSIEVFRLMTPPNGFPDYGAAAAINAILFVLLVGGLALYRRALREASRYATITGRGYRPAPVALGRWRWPATALVAFYFVCAVLLPFLALVWASVVPYFSGFSADMLKRASFAAYREILGGARPREAALHSAVIAIVAAAGLLVLSLATAWAVLRSRLRFAALLDTLAMIPLGVPPLMIGVALVFAAFSLRFLSLYGTIWLIAIGHVIVFLPVASRMAQAGLLQISGEIEEAGAMAGASPMVVAWRISAPLLAPVIGAILVWTLVHSVREFSIAVMLQSGRNTVLSTMLFNFWETGAPERAAAMAVMMMLGLLALVGASSVWTRRGPGV